MTVCDSNRKNYVSDLVECINQYGGAKEFVDMLDGDLLDSWCDSNYGEATDHDQCLQRLCVNLRQIMSRYRRGSNFNNKTINMACELLDIESACRQMRKSKLHKDYFYDYVRSDKFLDEMGKISLEIADGILKEEGK